jgi:hypothetical protein
MYRTAGDGFISHKFILQRSMLNYNYREAE